VRKPAAGLHTVVLDRLPGYGDQLAASAGAVFIRWAVPVRNGVSHDWRISRYDVRLGRITAVSPPIRGAVSMTLTGDAVWVSANSATAGDRLTGSLVKLQLSSLRVIARIDAPTAVGGIAATPSTLWVGGNGRLLRVDPSVDRIAGSVHVVGAVGQLAVDVGAGVLYVATHRPGEETAIALEERDLATGRLLSRSTAIKGYLAINTLAVTPDNVWVAYPTGTMGTADRFTRADLVRHRPAGEGTLVGTNGIDVLATRGILWNENPGGALSCLDPLTGDVRDRLTQPLGAGAVTGLRSQVYAVIGLRLERILPGVACRP
jgi:hypothetical protein